MKKLFACLAASIILTACKGTRVYVDQFGNKYRYHMPPSVRLDGSG